MKTKEKCTKHLISFSQSIDLQTKNCFIISLQKKQKIPNRFLCCSRWIGK